MKYLLDTDTFSEMVKGINPGITKRMATLKTGDAALSVITRGEIVFGLQVKSPKPLVKQRMDRLLGAIETLPMITDAASYYGELRAHLRNLGTSIGPNDLWIAAHARTLNLILVTNNTSEFSRVPKMKLDNWIS
jgi:tRNA(fMet)-specific endonuclease VapC